MLFPCAVVLGAAYGLCLVAGLVQVQRLAPADGLARLTAVYYLVTYTGFAAPYLLALGAHLAGYPTLLSITAGLALLTAGGVHLAASRRVRERSPGMSATTGRHAQTSAAHDGLRPR